MSIKKAYFNIDGSDYYEGYYEDGMAGQFHFLKKI